MFARNLAVLAVLLVAAPAFGDFHSTLFMVGTDDGAPLLTGGYVEEGSTMRLTVWDNQDWANTPPHADNRMTWVQLNFKASTAGLHDELLAGTWTWDATIPPAIFCLNVDDSLSTTWDPAKISTPDYMVMRSFVGGWPPSDAVPDLEVGMLEFTAPAHIPGGNNTYTVSLSGGWDDPGLKRSTISQFVGSQGEGSAIEWGNMTVENFEFTVTPEPATLALMAVGGVALFIRRKR